MKILDVRCLAIPEIKVIRYERFCDGRGYFTEHFRRSDVANNPATQFLEGIEFCQCNESFSRPGTIRGLHFQWNPLMGKLVRTLSGHMVDMVLDIRKGSPALGKILAYDMPTAVSSNVGEWIWVPPGFAHGNYFLEDTMIEYFCSGEYNAGCEAGISPLSPDIDWSLCDGGLRRAFDDIVTHSPRITDKDRNGFSLARWLENPASANFFYGRQDTGVPTKPAIVSSAI